MSQHERYMVRALTLAEKGYYHAAPNPRVGCVIVKCGQIVGEGWHQAAGHPHAEVMALQMAQNKANGADCYINLEPCCHHGKTPPCIDVLLQAQVKRVFIAHSDPNPLVSGQGIAALEKAGITVQQGLLEKRARQLNQGFIKRMSERKPWVIGKSAMSLDGRTAPASGQQQWLTGQVARTDVQKLRAGVQAIITGVNSIITDDSALTVRDPRWADLAQPTRVILDTALRTPVQAKCLTLPGKTIIVTASEDNSRLSPLVDQGAEVMVLPTHAQRIDLVAVLSFLAEREVNEVLVEAGATLMGAFVQQQLLDEWIIYMAPKLLGNEAKALVNLDHLMDKQDITNFTITETAIMAQDWRLTLHRLPH